MFNKLNLRKSLAPLAARGKAVLAKIALASICTLGWASIAQADYVWSGDITLGSGGTTATGSVGDVNYTISSTAVFQRDLIWNPETFSDTYNVPGDTGGANVYTFNESAGGTYTLTFDRPVENPLIAIASLGQKNQTVDFNFGSSVQVLWTGTYDTNVTNPVTYVNGNASSTTAIRGEEGYVVAKYSGTITSVTFTPSAETTDVYTGSMMVLVGFEVSTTAPTITAPGGTAGASTAAISVDELQTTVGDFDANKAVTWSISGGADRAEFAINSATGALSFASAPDFLNPTDSGTNNTYEVELTATDLQATPQTAVQTVTVTVTDATAPTVTFSPTNGATGVAVDSNITLTFSEAVRNTDDSALTDANVDALITLKDTDASGSAIPFDATISGNVITVNPTTDFSSLQQVYVEIDGTSVEDTANLAGSLASAAFTTADTTAPTVTFSPTNGATGVAVGSDITLTFSEAVRNTDDSVLTDANVDALITLKDTDASGSAIPFDATISGNVITVNPTSDFSSSQQVYVAIGATVEDSANNALTASSATFTTVDTIAPTVTFSPSDSATGVAVDSNITLTFSEAVRLIDDTALSDTNVDALITLKDTDNNGAAISFDATINSNVITITPSSNFTYSQQVYVAIGATVEDASDNAITATNSTFTVEAGSPAFEFEKSKADIKQVIVDDASRSLSSALNANRRMTQNARERFVADQQADVSCGHQNDEMRSNEDIDCDYNVVTRNFVPFDVDGSARVSDGVLSTSGTFFGQRGTFDGTQRRLVFGDFDVQHDSGTGSTTATLSGKVAWEWMTSETTMLGYFLGGELAKSDLSGTFTGEQERVAVSVGGYAVHELRENLYADGFVSLGMGTNNLDMANDTLTLASDYTTRSATLGGSLSGVVAQEGFELRPELAFSYGKTWIGNVGFTGWAYGLVDNTLSLDAGNVSIANLTFRPEVVIPMDATSTASFAPRLICEQVKTTTTQENCGAGAEFGLQSTSEDGLSNLTAKVIADRVGNSTRTSLQMNFERRF